MPCCVFSAKMKTDFRGSKFQKDPRCSWELFSHSLWYDNFVDLFVLVLQNQILSQGKFDYPKTKLVKVTNEFWKKILAWESSKGALISCTHNCFGWILSSLPFSEFGILYYTSSVMLCDLSQRKSRRPFSGNSANKYIRRLKISFVENII
jgi:hypothetical protein